jgi:prepilin-type N-terminal cleavage/methylation domain-containing protein
MPPEACPGHPPPAARMRSHQGALHLNEMSQTRRGFSLIELLVVITIITIVIAMMLPALGAVMRSARETRCLASMQQMGIAFTGYSDANRDWFPLMPVPVGLPQASNQFLYGGVAGLFSLDQQGNGAQRGFTGGQYSNGAIIPLMSGYLSSFAALRCPTDTTDRYYGMPYGPTGNLSYAAAAVMQPMPPGSAEDVVSYNISYMYLPPAKAGRTSLIWLDETNGPDINDFGWYGPRGTMPGNTSPNSIAAGSAGVGIYAPDDNHGASGANILISDGHAYFHKAFFAEDRLIID